MKRKTFEQGSLKLLQAPGEFECVFATLGVVDKEGDVINRGAVGEQDVRISAWGHDWGKLPVGRGRAFERGNEAVCEGKFFLDTEGGAETYRVVKGLADLQEWSFGYDVLESEPGKVDGQQARMLRKLSIFEVSPVLLGAGVSTRTTAIKTAEKGYDFGSWIAEDPARALVQMRYHAAEMGVKLDGPEIPSDPGEAKAAILALSDPGELAAILESELFEADVAELEATVKQGSDQPTNFDRLVQQARAAFGPDVSDEYVITMARAHLADMALQMQRNNAGVNPHAAWQQVAAWARRPA